MHVKERAERGVAIFAVDGRFDHHAGADLRREAASLLDAGYRAFVVDLSLASRIESSGVGSLIALERAVRERGAVLRVACPDPAQRWIFEQTRTHEILDIYEDPEDAAADAEAFAKRAPGTNADAGGRP